jgi:hypothetical protein
MLKIPSNDRVATQIEWHCYITLIDLASVKEGTEFLNSTNEPVMARSSCSKKAPEISRRNTMAGWSRAKAAVAHDQFNQRFQGCVGYKLGCRCPHTRRVKNSVVDNLEPSCC